MRESTGQAGGPAVDPRVVRTRNDVLGTAIKLLIDDGWSSVTHQHVAREAGYSKATVYAHWPTRVDLIRDAFVHFGDMGHHVPTGDLRTDLALELVSFRTAMEEHKLDRALAVLADLAASIPELVEVREQFVSDGELGVRSLLAPFVTGTELEATTLMLCGAVLHAALLHGRPPDDELIESAVELALRGIGWTEPSEGRPRKELVRSPAPARSARRSRPTTR